MGPFQLAPHIDKARAAQTRRELFDQLVKDKKLASEFTGKPDPSQRDIADALDRMMEEESKWPFYRNERYQVQVRDCEQLDEGWPAMVWLSIRRLDREPIRDWRDMQEIKNMLVGPEHEGFELYPAERRLTDCANQYHLFVFKDPKVILPVGFMMRGVSDMALSTGKQRPRK